MSRPALLIVDDEPEILELLAEIFEDYEVSTALNTDLALARLESAPCDLLITDIKMPGKSGMVLISLAKQRWPALPVIVITGHYQDASAAERSLVFRWVTKPFHRREIRDTVAQALQRSTT